MAHSDENTLDQQEENQSFADFLEQFMPRPLANFLDYFSRIYALVFVLIPTILHMTFGIDFDTHMHEIGVTAMCMHGILCCAIFGWLLLKLISKVF